MGGLREVEIFRALQLIIQFAKHLCPPTISEHPVWFEEQRSLPAAPSVSDSEIRAFKSERLQCLAGVAGKRLKAFMGRM